MASLAAVRASAAATPAQFATEAPAHLRTLIHLGDAVRAKREREGLSYRQAAAASGVQIATIHDIENGLVDVRLSTAFRLMEWVTS